jgi:hypothetical protein
MTIPEYDEECDCDLCKSLRYQRDTYYKTTIKKRIKEEIRRVTKEHQEFKPATATTFQEEYMR